MATECDKLADDCIPGCSPLNPRGPPDWCSRENPQDEGPWLTCSMGWGRSGVRPWRPEDFGGPGGFLDHFTAAGEAFERVGDFKGCEAAPSIAPRLTAAPCPLSSHAAATHLPTTPIPSAAISASHEVYDI